MTESSDYRKGFDDAIDSVLDFIDELRETNSDVSLKLLKSDISEKFQTPAVESKAE